MADHIKDYSSIWGYSKSTYARRGWKRKKKLKAYKNVQEEGGLPKAFVRYLFFFQLKDCLKSKNNLYLPLAF